MGHRFISSITAKQSLRWSIADGMAWAVMIGVSESYLGAFAVKLGFVNTELALLTTVPILMGTLSQFATALLIERVRGRKRLVVCGALIQAFSQLALFYIAMEQYRSFFLLLSAKVIFWISGTVITPAWNSWMSSLTEEISRERYFATRSALTHVSLLVAFVAAGYAHYLGEQRGTDFGVYALLFAVAFIARVLSALSLGFMQDLDGGRESRASTWVKVQHALAFGKWRVAVFIGWLMFGAHIAIPFFTPYMLRTLKMNMMVFSALTVAAIFAKAVSFFFWDRAAARFGMPAVFIISVSVIATLPLQWALLSSASSLAWVEILSGIAWGGFEYASLQLLIRDAPKRADVEFFSLGGALSGVLQLGGSLTGSWLLFHYSPDYRITFVASSAARTLALFILIPIFSDLVMRGPAHSLFTRFISVRQGAGAIRRLIRVNSRKKS
ncbi:MAG: MFS transporter [Deltaproteobacteria bacterium]|nr:MFS transporter [Deltaproteobacteria bacterium]